MIVDGFFCVKTHGIFRAYMVFYDVCRHVAPFAMSMAFEELEDMERYGD